jgi:hypothetical protein
LKEICIRETSEQVSSTIGLLPAVEPSFVLMHSPDTTLLTRYLPAAAVEAVNVHSCGGLRPSPQPYCCSWVPETVDELGTSIQRVLLTLARLNWPLPRSTAFHC